MTWGGRAGAAGGRRVVARSPPEARPYRGDEASPYHHRRDAGATKKMAPTRRAGAWNLIYPGDVLISRGLAPKVLPPLRVLTAVFGMGTGVSPSP